jgi:hypothetical protein
VEHPVQLAEIEAMQEDVGMVVTTEAAEAVADTTVVVVMMVITKEVF